VSDRSVEVADRRGVLRDALGVGLATGAYGLSFGAVAVGSGLSLLQACALSVLLFSGGSQFALVGVAAAGGSPLAGVATAGLLGIRNGVYGLRLAPLLRLHGWLRPLGAHLTIDESTAMAIRHDDPHSARLAFWSTGLAVFVLWNVATVAGGLTTQLVGDPAVIGLDAAVPAAFIALLWPALREADARLVALVGLVIALALSPAMPAGLPVLVAGLGAVLVTMARRPTPPAQEGRTPPKRGKSS